MNLDTLDRFDPKTASAVLAAASFLTSPDAGISEEPGVIAAYAKEADELLSEIRAKLKISAEDKSAFARTSLDSILTKALRTSVLKGNPDDALFRAGQTGKMPPSMYRVEEKPSFTKNFHPLGVKKRNVEDAVRFPDDYQHLMTNLADAASKDVISLFMKKILGTVGGDFWLLVQTHRLGMTQVVQSAWRVYADLVELRNAETPLDVLKAFVKVFGVPVTVGGQEYLFLESQLAPKRDVLKFGIQADKEVFGSLSQTATPDPSLVQVGMAYSIDIKKYRAELVRRGVIL